MKKGIILVSLISFMLLITTTVDISAELPSKPKKEATGSQQEAGNNQRGSDQLPIVVKVLPTEKNKVEAENATKEQEEKTFNDKRLVQFTGLLAFIALLQLVVFAWQARCLGRTVEATKEAANAAIRGNELNRKTFISSQRPWVVVHKIIPSSALDLNSGLSFTFVVKNVGNSPGMNVDVSAIMHLPHSGDAHQAHRHLREVSANERKKRTAIEDISFGHLLVPQEEMEIAVRATNNPAEYQKAAAAHPFGEIIILILGQVCYRFGIDESWHESGFMFSVRRRGGINVTLDNMIVPIEEVEIERFPAGFYAT